MPIYVYRCLRCGNEVEELQKFDDPPPEGPPCAAASEDESLCALERVVSAGFHKFRGDGSSDGIGGWKQQGQLVDEKGKHAVMVRQVPGDNTESYGKGHV